MRLLLTGLMLLSLMWSPTLAQQCARGTLTAEVTYVRDGDTIELGDTAIRLSGLAAPEWDESGGTEAREAMIELVRGRTVRCELDGTRTYDRCAGVCYLDGEDISEVMVHRGVAGYGLLGAHQQGTRAAVQRGPVHDRGLDAHEVRIFPAPKKGREVADANVASSLYRKALSSDVAARFIWLKNRRPDLWCDRGRSTPTRPSAEKPKPGLLTSCRPRLAEWVRFDIDPTLTP